MHLIIQIVLILLAIALVRFVYENKVMLIKKRITLRHDGLKIMHIADNHRRNKAYYNDRIRKLAEEEKPDLIFITGDYVSRRMTDFSAGEKLLNELCTIAPVYMCMGNHEQSILDENRGKFFEMLGRTKAKMLMNEGVFTEIRGRKIYICGMHPEYSAYKKDDSYKDLDDFSYEDMKKAIGDKPECETFLLAHNPLFADVYGEWGAEHAFCGHTHGGAVRIFGIALLSPERKFFPKYSSCDVYNLGRTELFVSAGVGKLRFLDPPSVSFYII